MRRDFTMRKRVIVGALALLVLADIALAAYSFQLASAPQSPMEEFAAQAKLHDRLLESISKAQKIRDNIPAIQKDCDQFEKSLFPASSGYSAVISELGDTARKSGIQIDDLTHKQTEISNRGMTEVSIDATVNGNYKNVIGFLNGLQRSPNHYAVDSLTLGAEANQASANVIKVALHLRTYFRTAA